MGSLLIFEALHNYLPRPTCGNEIKCCQEPFCVWVGGREGGGGFGTDSFLARPRKKTFLVGFVLIGMVMVTSSGSVLPSSIPFSMFGIFLNSLLLCLGIVVTGPVVFFGMVGCLVLMTLVVMTLGLFVLVNWLLLSLNGA